MASNSYAKRMGDRKEGRQLHSLAPLMRLSPYIMRRRSDACDGFADSVEVSEIEPWLLQKRAEGKRNMGLMHLVVAAYVRTVSVCPGVNRFVAGRRLFARNDIQVSMMIRRGTGADAALAPVKVSFSPTDTIYSVYDRLNDAVDLVQADSGASETERLADSLRRIPRFFLRIVMAGLRLLDYFDWMPRRLLDASPFHASLGLIDMGSLGIGPVEPHIYDFGNIPCFISYGAKRRVYELDREGEMHERRYVDYRFTCDERINTATYYAAALKCFKYYLKNPQLLELPPERFEDDVN